LPDAGPSLPEVEFRFLPCRPAPVLNLQATCPPLARPRPSSHPRAANGFRVLVPPLAPAAVLLEGRRASLRSQESSRWHPAACGGLLAFPSGSAGNRNAIEQWPARSAPVWP